jgi:hypothetical protein
MVIQGNSERLGLSEQTSPAKPAAKGKAAARGTSRRNGGDRHAALRSIRAIDPASSEPDPNPPNRIKP